MCFLFADRAPYWSTNTLAWRTDDRAIDTTASYFYFTDDDDGDFYTYYDMPYNDPYFYFDTSQGMCLLQ